jgi:site-specific DNA-methyltransferase (adenine-specific)
MTPYYQDDAVTIYHGDCREILPTLDPVDLVLTDPPYGKVKGDFDHEWTNRPKMLKSCKEWIDAIVPAMKPNATLYWFAWPSLAGRIEALIAERLNLLAHIVWKKPSSVALKACPEALRAPIPETERIIMAEHYGADNHALGESGYQAECDKARGMIFEPLRAYLAGEWKRAGLTAKDANAATNSQMATHYLTTSQWALPTQERYEQLREYANKHGSREYLRKDYEDLRKDYEYLRKDYEDLRKDYEDLRKDYEDLRRFFDMKTGDQKTDVWEFASESHNYGHPTVKPLALIYYMARLSCRPTGTILDPFMGSGTTLRAAKDLHRKAIGIEREERYCEIAARRMLQEVLPL